MDFSWEGEELCVDWLKNASYANTWALSIPAVIALVGWIVKSILRRMSKFEGHKNRPAEVYNAAKYMWFLATLNIGFII